MKIWHPRSGGAAAHRFPPRHASKTCASQRRDELRLSRSDVWEGRPSRASSPGPELGSPASGKPPMRESHPVQSDRFLDRLANGRITPRPGIERLAGDRVIFSDGTDAVADLIVWATGYRVSFPFFDESFVSAPGNELPLWKRTIHPDVRACSSRGCCSRWER